MSVPGEGERDARPEDGDRKPATVDGEDAVLETIRKPGAAVVKPCGSCEYCGCPLDPRLYFCPGCATPYKSVQDVLPRARPKKLTDGELIRRKAPHAMTVFWVYFSALVGCAVLSVMVFEGPKFDWQSYFILSEFVLLATTAVVGAIYWRSLAVQLKELGLIRWEVLAGVAALLPLLLVNYTYHSWVHGVLDDDGFRPTNPLAEGGFDKLTLVVVMCVFPAILEELSFRGLVQHWMQSAVTPLKAIVYASALFTVLHFSAVSAPYIFAVGALLGWVKFRTRSLYGPMLIHFLHNYCVLELF